MYVLARAVETNDFRGRARPILKKARNRNRNLKTSKALLKSQAHQGTSLFTSAATNQRGVSKGGVKRSSGPNSRVPGGDRVAVRVGVVEMGRGNYQKGQGRRD